MQVIELSKILLDMRIALIILCLFSSYSCSAKKEKTVFIAILARNKAHTLPAYLKTIEELDYNKKAITIYINTNNNADETEQVLLKWAEEHQHEYANLLFESHSVPVLEQDETSPHGWDKTRLQVMAKIRNQSMQKALEEGSDYYFVVDCDCFITPNTLKTLVTKEKPIIAPLMRTYPTILPASTYWCDYDHNGFCREHPFYYEILHHHIRGTFSVPLVHCVYLVDCKYIPQLDYLDPDMGIEFIAFSQSARREGIQQFICNEEEFGFVYWINNSISLEEERKAFNELFGEVR